MNFMIQVDMCRYIYSDVSAVSRRQGSGPLSSYLLGLAGYRVTCMLGAAISTTSFLATAVLIHLEVTTFLPVDLDSYSRVFEYHQA